MKHSWGTWLNAIGFGIAGLVLIILGIYFIAIGPFVFYFPLAPSIVITFGMGILLLGFIADGIAYGLYKHMQIAWKAALIILVFGIIASLSQFFIVGFNLYIVAEMALPVLLLVGLLWDTTRKDFGNPDLFDKKHVAPVLGLVILLSIFTGYTLLYGVDPSRDFIGSWTVNAEYVGELPDPFDEDASQFVFYRNGTVMVTAGTSDVWFTWELDGDTPEDDVVFTNGGGTGYSFMYGFDDYEIYLTLTNGASDSFVLTRVYSL